MRPAPLEDYVRDPVGRYVAGRSYLVWVASPALAGASYFGRLDEREAPDILRVTTMPEGWAAATGYDVMIDCGRLEAMDTQTFASLLRYLYEVTPVTTRLRRVSIVRPPGLTGAVIAGVFHDNVQPRFRSALFADRAEAFAWLGHPATSELRARIDAVTETVAGAPQPLGTLREHLARRPAAATMAGAARTLGISERSLSRRLKELGTSFRAESQRARLRAAESLLIDTELKLDAVATRVGFASRAHFSDFFHKATGETPSDFRARRR